MKGGFGNLFKQAQELQSKLQEAQENLEKVEVNGEAGAGLVKVRMNGRHDVSKVEIDPSLLTEDKEILEDLLAAAVNDAVRRIEEEKANATSNLGINLPPGFKMPF